MARAKIGNIEIEGTADEIAAILRSVSWDIKPAVASKPQAQSARRYIDSEVAFKAIKRRPLSLEQSAMLRLLRDNHPNWTSAAKIREATRYNPNQLAGMFGAFGKRVSATEGFIAGSWFFEQEWDYDNDEYVYRLSDPALQAVLRAGL